MKRRLFNLLCGVSAAAFVAVLCIWAYSFFSAGYVCWVGSTWSVIVFSERNILAVRLYEDVERRQTAASRLYIAGFPNPDYVRHSGLWDELSRPGPDGAWVFPALGLGYSRGHTAQDYGWRFGNRPIHSVYVPHWLAAVVFSVMPSIWLVRTARLRRRVRSGCCLTCGYDLRASTDRCPECGTAIDPKRASLSQAGPE